MLGDEGMKKRILLMVCFVLLMVNVKVKAVNTEPIPYEEQKALFAVHLAYFNESLYYYDIAVENINEIGEEKVIFKNSLFKRLNEVVPKIYTSEMVSILDDMKTLVKGKDPVLYQDIVNRINLSQNLKEVDKTYLLEELAVWGK